MSSLIILENLNKLCFVKSFVEILEMRFLSDDLLAQKIKISKKSLDKALIYLTHDLSEKIYDKSKSNKALDQIDFAVEFVKASENLSEIKDESLSKILGELIEFARDYKSDYAHLNLKSDQDILRKIEDKVLCIMSERYI